MLVWGKRSNFFCFIITRLERHSKNKHASFLGLFESYKDKNVWFVNTITNTHRKQGDPIGQFLLIGRHLKVHLILEKMKEPIEMARALG